LWPLSSNG